MLGSDVFWLSLYSILQLVASDAYFNLKFLTFTNPNGRRSDGQWCDSFSHCDHMFNICLDDIPGAGIRDRCVRSGDISEANFIRFSNSIGGISNPISRRLNFWPGRIGVTIEVLDADVKHNDHVDTLHGVISLQPDRTWRQFLLFNRVKLFVDAEAFCGHSYYGPDCRVFCQPRDDALGHYSCNQRNGDKVCTNGWTGRDCNNVVQNCFPNRCQNGGVCQNLINSFKCLCPVGVKGNQCEQDINECLDQDVCHHGDCINTVGSFACNCQTGYAGQTCEINIDECASSPCQNGGSCLDLTGGFLCKCLEGFTGIHCGNDINECDHLNVTCTNGSVCVNIPGSYSCQCPSGYTGHTCKDDVNECLNDPCRHNSTCLDLPGSYRCECETGYTGVNCEENINECLEGICKNGATCTDMEGSFSCVCSPFWQGRTCEEDVNECLSDPCKHGGTCENINRGFLCVCPKEFEGSLCEEDRNECDLLETCENNSTCINRFGSFTCECLKGWSGSRCEVDINECETVYCNNSGTCINVEGGYLCECPKRWTGTTCEEEVEECALEVSPCRNNATCLNRTDTFYCECEQGWTGHLCSEDLNECLQSPDICSTREHSQVIHNLPSLTPSNRVCMNTYPGYVCGCSEGRAGQDCELRVDTSKPFYLACYPSDNLTINENLRQIFLDTQLFQGKELNVSHRAGPEKLIERQEVMSSIYPVVTVDGKQMSNHEVIYVINMVSDKIKDYLHCSIVLNVTQRNSSFSTLSSQKYSNQDWYPGLFTACAVLVVVVVVVLIIHYQRKKRMFNLNNMQNISIESSRSFSNRMYTDSNFTAPLVDDGHQDADYSCNFQDSTILQRPVDRKPASLIENPTYMPFDDKLESNYSSFNSFRPTQACEQAKAAVDEEQSSQQASLQK